MSYSIEQLILQKKPIFTATYIHPEPSAQTNIPKLKVWWHYSQKKYGIYILDQQITNNDSKTET